MWYARKWFPRNKVIRQLHPVMICIGGINWAPYNFSYFLPAVVVACVSWLWLKKKHLAFWSK